MVHVPAPGQNPPTKHISRKWAFILAERTQESGGNYLVTNPNTGALGAWQVMPENLPGWLSASGISPMSDYDYLHNDKAQNRLAWVILGGYYDKYGPAAAAAVWYCGKPTPDATYGDPPVYQYVADVLALMRKGGFPVSNTPETGEPGWYTLPPPNEGDWSAQIKAAATAHINAADKLNRYARSLDRLR